MENEKSPLPESIIQVTKPFYFGSSLALLALAGQLRCDASGTRWTKALDIWKIHALNYCMLLPGPEAQQLTLVGLCTELRED